MIIDRKHFDALFENVHRHDRTRVKESLDKALLDTSGTWQEQYRIKTRQGKVRHLLNKARIPGIGYRI